MTGFNEKKELIQVLLDEDERHCSIDSSEFVQTRTSNNLVEALEDELLPN